MFDELALQRVQFIAVSHPFDRFDLAALRFGTKHKTRTNNPSVDDRAACPAIPCAATFLRAHQAEAVAQDIQQSFVRLAKILYFIAVDRGGYCYG